jgi:hypothetical protein
MINKPAVIAKTAHGYRPAEVRRRVERGEIRAEPEQLGLEVGIGKYPADWLPAPVAW